MHRRERAGKLRSSFGSVTAWRHQRTGGIQISTIEPYRRNLSKHRRNRFEISM
jgi:hypothetical protein